MEMEQITPITKDCIRNYINEKDHLRVEDEGRFFRCRIGERSHMEGRFTSRLKAELALRQYVGNLMIGEQKRVAKRKANAKKSKS